MRGDGGAGASDRLSGLAARRESEQRGWVPDPDWATGAAPSAAGERRGDPQDDAQDDGLPPAPGTRRRVPRPAVVAALLLAGAVTLGAVARGVLSDAGAVQPQSRTTTLPRQPIGQSNGSAAAAVATPGPSGAGSSEARLPGAGSSRPGQVVVDVVGRVRHPGLARLPVGSRVADALAAVGGPVRGAAVDRVNLARPVLDGEQIVVPGRDDPLAAGGVTGPPGQAGDPGQGGQASGQASGQAAGQATGQPLDLNAATAAQLDALPGVGPVTAGRIIAWRGQHQRFSRVDELGEVPGIGPKTLERLRPLVRV